MAPFWAQPLCLYYEVTKIKEEQTANYASEQ